MTLQPTSKATLPDLMPIRHSRTKTVATIGPASSSYETLTELIQAGVDVFRINMAHGSRESHTDAVTTIRRVSRETGLPAGILIDLAGPKIRLGQLAQDQIELERGNQVRFVRGLKSKSENELTCSYQSLIDEVSIGDAIVLADGLAHIRVAEKDENGLVCDIIDGGIIRSRQGVNLPGTFLSLPAIGDADRDNAIWAAKLEVDFVSLSFVRNADEIIELQQLLTQHDSEALVIAKIEKREALNELDSIVNVAGGVMIARGDLGVEIDIEKTPAAQRRIIDTCLVHRKPVIVATQMLESMHNSKQPTRAEVTDVANAILDGADACMLSGETAIGSYPVAAVTMMNKIMYETEKELAGRESAMPPHRNPTGWETSESVILGAAQIARRIDAQMVVIACREASTALIKSKQRNYIPTVCVTDQLKALRQMTLFWGVIPVHCEQPLNESDLQNFINQWAKQSTCLLTGATIVVVTDNQLLPGSHDSLMVAKIE